MSTATLQTPPASDALGPAPTWDGPCEAVISADEAVRAAQAELRRLVARRAEIPALDAAAVQAADGVRMRDVARRGEDLDALITAAEITHARLLVTLRKEQEADARRRVPAAQERLAAAQAATQHARAALQRAARAESQAMAIAATVQGHVQGATQAHSQARLAVEALLAAAPCPAAAVRKGA